MGLGLLLALIAAIDKQWRVPGTKTEADQPVVGIVLPHHDLARELIIQAGERLKQEINPRYIVVMAPNHFRPQSYTFSSSLALKDFSVAENEIRRLKEFDPNLILDKDLLEAEHGVVIPISYLQNFFPQAKFIPLIISPYFVPEKLRETAGFLVKIMPEDTLYVASIDFAHEKMVWEAAANNQETIATIGNFDYRLLLDYGNDHLDSPAAMGMLMHIGEKLGAKNWQTWFDSHGAKLTGDPTLQGTSYVVGVFR